MTLDGADVAFEHHGKDLVIQRAGERGRAVRARGHATPARPSPTPHRRHAATSATTGWHDHRRRRGVDDAGAVRRLHVVRRQRPALRQGALRLHASPCPSPWIGIANGELVSTQTEHDGLTHDPRGTWPSRRRRTSSRSPSATTRGPSNTSRAAWRSPTGSPSDRPALASGLRARRPALDWLEEMLGPYPFDTPRLPARRLAQRHGDPDHDHARRHRLHDVRRRSLVHEMAHQWYGDQVTPDDWRDVWMNEGMAMYLQGMWEAERRRHHRRRADGRVGGVRGQPARECGPARRLRPGAVRRAATSTTARP